ncbi:MAG TPA: type II toxin-antitoxin system prevent-host-death family antitoxin [Planctomycetaceae bacterium]|nr:type II toxin-antitoxin system prevent-host-death family antitoxin [Planctomycetaceae bacterium]
MSEVARRFGEVLDEVEREQEEIILVRNCRQVARLVPEPPQHNALEVFGDLAGTLDEQTANALLKAVNTSRKGPNATLKALRNPWAS